MTNPLSHCNRHRRVTTIKQAAPLTLMHKYTTSFAIVSSFHFFFPILTYSLCFWAKMLLSLKRMAGMSNSNVCPNSVLSIKLQKMLYIVKPLYWTAVFYPEDPFWWSCVCKGFCSSTMDGKLRAVNWLWLPSWQNRSISYAKGGGWSFFFFVVPSAS